MSIARFYLGHIMLLPPSMARVWPVMKEAPGLARKPTVSATCKTKVVVSITLLICFEDYNLLHSSWPTHGMGGLAVLKEPVQM